jgi:carboxyl-terminal processing protease
MKRIFIFLALVLQCFAPFQAEARLPEIDPKAASAKLQEIMQSHATHKVMNEMLAKRALLNYLEEVDPAKTYFLTSDIDQWLEPSDSLSQKLVKNYENSEFVIFTEIHNAMKDAIKRRAELEEEIADVDLPEKVQAIEFKDLEWVATEDLLKERLLKIKSLQMESAEKLDEDVRDISMQRIKKRRTKFEDNFTKLDAKDSERFILSNLLKATASALDSHTSYFTPDEASQFMISVQQRLFGIGAQLRDDINGFTIVKVIEGGPAARGGDLKAKDRIIAVDGEPVVGMDIIEAVELIRGKEDTTVVLTVIRKGGEDSDNPDESKKEEIEEKLDLTIVRGEVVITESRLETTFEPYGDGVIAHLRLHSFYQDPESSSAGDIVKAIKELEETEKINGIILDLRSNSGGMLTQAVAVTGLFMTKGVVVSIRDEKDKVQHLRDIDGKTLWDGPLLVLTNRGSASASEIVAQTLQDYGRAIVVGDDHTFGKGSFQTFTLNSSDLNAVNKQGEFKVTRGKYYTVSGKTPQLVGVKPELEVAGPLTGIDIGESYGKYPLENDTIKENYEDDLSDIPYLQRERVRRMYRFDLQPKLTYYKKHLDTLAKNSTKRLEDNKNYQNFLKELEKKKLEEEDTAAEEEDYGHNDMQLTEAYNIMKDLILLLL